jgi:putative ABC transport system substrate-binding protein
MHPGVDSTLIHHWTDQGGAVQRRFISSPRRWSGEPVRSDAARERSVAAIGRRQMLAATAGAAAMAALPLALAQRQEKTFRIGYLSLRAGPSSYDKAFFQRLRELGYESGRNLFVEYRWANNDMARLERQAEELVRLRVDVIVTAVTTAVRAAKKATATIPIVMVAAADPVGTGIVASLGHPEGNVTGLSFLSTDLAGKRLQLLHEIVPGAARFGLLAWRPGEPDPASAREGAAERFIAESEAAGRHLGVEVYAQIVKSADDLPNAFTAMAHARAQALIVQVSALTYEHRAEILDAARRMRLPDMYESKDIVEAGGLVSYGPDVTELYRSAAAYVDKILRGARPGDLPIDQPSKVELVLNLRTARALGITVPQSLLLRADRVIQ